MKKRRSYAPPIKLTGTVIICLALFFSINYIWRGLKNLDYFKIKDIVVKNIQPEDYEVQAFSYFKGKNIFNINLKQESQVLLEYYPDCSAAQLVRVLPNRLIIFFIRRKPVALVKLYKYFALDEGGVLFYPQEQYQGLELPIILGLETKIFGPKPGKKYNNKAVLLVLNILKEIKKNKFLKNYKVKKFDLANIASASIFLAVTESSPITQELEIILGEDKIKDKIDILSNLAEEERFNLTNIKYIDLRFKEPVIKFYDVKSK
jgi:cell division septal protein FtsQ